MDGKVQELFGIIQRTPFRWPENLIHLYVGGSDLHGAKTKPVSDLDLFGVYVEPPAFALGIPQYEDDTEQPEWIEPNHFAWKTAEVNQRNQPGDIDVNLYCLRKWALMAAKGNPTALQFLFTSNLAITSGIWEKWIRPNTQVFLSSHAGLHFFHFAKRMLSVLKGEGPGRRGQRPDLVAEFGYDTKAAMHLIRVLQEGIELMTTGVITFPRPEKDLLTLVRQGQYGTLKQIEHFANELSNELESARKDSVLKEEVDRPAVSEIIACAYLDFWTHHAAEFTEKGIYAKTQT